jgi:hypothetical protein
MPVSQGFACCGCETSLSFAFEMPAATSRPSRRDDAGVVAGAWNNGGFHAMQDPFDFAGTKAALGVWTPSFRNWKWSRRVDGELLISQSLFSRETCAQQQSAMHIHSSVPTGTTRPFYGAYLKRN